MCHVLFPDLTDRLPAGLYAPDGSLDLTPAQVVELSQIEHHADAAYRKHEHQENGFFSGSRDVALHFFEAWVAVTLKNPRHAETIEKILACQEANLQGIPENHLNDVKAGDPFLPANLGTLPMGKAPGGIGDLLYFQTVWFFLSSPTIATMLN